VDEDDLEAIDLRGEPRTPAVLSTPTTAPSRALSARPTVSNKSSS
jgi:hypothetical protein